MQHTDKAIAEFEAWAGSEAFGLSPAHFAKDEAGDYINYPTQCYWMVWQASRAELVIELPPQVTAEDVREAVPFDADGDYAVDAAHMVNGAISACGSFVKAAGVTVRG
ncbi:hypothetical protein [Stutzerimonas nitrititolerans]|uniref:hypothetical protein n=1 Tax=Stutzerimonas nitrititolerans TaxID=2482751 RepID=UPI0028AA2EF7|nr:hypothetical protein [Stutzerimonas nitrititolerans]